MNVVKLEKNRILLAFAVMVVCLFFVMPVARTEAGEQLYFDEQGNLRMTTYDRIATNNKTYKTIGWTIKRYDMPIGAGNESVVVVLEDDGEPQVDSANPAYQYCYFWCDKQTIFDKIGQVSAQWQKELYSSGGTVYLDAVMTVCVDGIPQGGFLDSGNTSWGRVFNTFEGISQAESWTDPEALRSHYNKQVYFPANPAMIVTYCDYQVRYFECFDNNSEYWSLSRYQKNRSGKLKKGENISLETDIFSGYYYEFDSARIRTTNANGAMHDSWKYQGNVEFTYTDTNVVSVRIDLFYKRKELTSTMSDIFQLQDNQVVMDCEMKIQEGNRDVQTFDVLSGVPTGENLYVEGAVNAFGYEVHYKKHYGLKTVPVIIESFYKCQWTDESGNLKTDYVLKPETYYVDRPYSYWEIEDIEVYSLQSAVVSNYAFENEQINLGDLYTPDIIIEQKKTHIQMTSLPTFQMYGDVLNGEPGKVQIPEGLQQQKANELIGQYTVENDAFSIDGEVFLAGNAVTAYAGDPKIGSTGKRIALYEENLKIPLDKKNGYRYQSKAVINYVNYQDQTVIEQNFWTVNPVTIHTPVVCQGFITDDKQFNQLCQPDESKKTWILGRNFEVAIKVHGQHKDIKGYGLRDYGKYVKAYQVNFPFEVYYGDVYYDANTWIDYVEGKQFYLPTGVPEGEYTITVRTVANNVTDVENVNMDEGWNESFSQYGAYENIDVVVAGRLYGLKITDIKREEWKEVFYKEDGLNTGIGYYIGLHNENGTLVRKNSHATFPILTGGNPNHREIEGEPLGTTFSYELQTIGDYDKTEGVYVEPRFFVVDKLTGKKRQEVDIYYFYEKDGKEVWENVRTRNESGEQYLRQNARTNIGIPAKNVKDVITAQNSVQKWRGEFSLPKNIFVLPKGFDIDTYLIEHGTLDNSDNILIEEGYLLVQLDIYAVKDRANYLSYINAENASNGYGSMWQIEGFVNPKKRWDTTWFYLEMGDVFLYDLATNKGKVHKVVGTH